MSDLRAWTNNVSPSARHLRSATNSSRWSRGRTKGASRRLVDIVENPIDAYNTSRVGLSVSSLAELATYAHIRLPDISQRAKGGAGKRGTQQAVDARMAYVWPLNDLF